MQNKAQPSEARLGTVIGRIALVLGLVFGSATLAQAQKMRDDKAAAATKVATAEKADPKSIAAANKAVAEAETSVAVALSTEPSFTLKVKESVPVALALGV